MKNERYALLVIIPKSIDGLRSVIENLSTKALNDITTLLESDPIELLMPKFHVDTTSRAEKSMKKVRPITFRNTKIFNLIYLCFRLV